MSLSKTSGGISKVKRLGILIPSSNTVVEMEAPKLIPIDQPVTLHYSRFRVTEISNSSASEAQFQLQAMVDAAVLLADAEVDLIVWTGTAASWLGFERDQSLCAVIRDHTGIPATTAVMAINNELSELKARRIALVTPYTAALEEKIIGNYASIGIETVASERLDLTKNTDIATVPEEQIAEMCRATTKAAPEGIVIMCTNLRGASVSTALKYELRIPVLDSVAATFRHCIINLYSNNCDHAGTGHI
jgi:maleate isomerase